MPDLVPKLAPLSRGDACLKCRQRKIVSDALFLKFGRISERISNHSAATLKNLPADIAPVSNAPASTFLHPTRYWAWRVV